MHTSYTLITYTICTMTILDLSDLSRTLHIVSSHQEKAFKKKFFFFVSFSFSFNTDKKMVTYRVQTFSFSVLIIKKYANNR